MCGLYTREINLNLYFLYSQHGIQSLRSLFFSLPLPLPSPLEPPPLPDRRRSTAEPPPDHRRTTARPSPDLAGLSPALCCWSANSDRQPWSRASYMASSAASSHSENSSNVSDPSIYTNYINVHLSIDKLTGHNYATWSYDVRLCFKS